MEKICCGCKKSLDLSFFNKNKSKKDGLQTKCRICTREYSREYYNKNIEYSLEYAKIRNNRIRKRNKKFVDEYKKYYGCLFCNEDEVVCLDFHHKNPNDKDFWIADGVKQGFSIKKIKKEIKKCIVVCSNCHRKLHAGIIII